MQLGIVASLNRPGGNITGVSHIGVALAPKRLQLLLELVPTASVIGVLENPSNPRIDLEVVGLEAATQSVGKRLLIVTGSGWADIDKQPARTSGATILAVPLTSACTVN